MNIIRFIIICIIFIILYFVSAAIISRDVTAAPDRKYSIKEDGVQIYKQVLTEDEIDMLKQKCENKKYEFVKKYLINSPRLSKVIKDLGDDYEFQDYIWVIQKSTVHTCHRDNNGDFFNEKQKYPSYTLLVYLEDMEKCLGVVPESHKDVTSYNINLTNPVVNLLCNKGDIIIFNANLIHVGTINSRDDNLRIQMKVTHREDIPILNYYQNYNKVLNSNNNIPKPLIHFQKNLSCLLPVLSNMSQSENIRSARGSDNGAEIGMGQKIFSLLFYGNSNYYDLPNAF